MCVYIYKVVHSTVIVVTYTYSLQTFDKLKTSLENMRKFQMRNDTNVKQNIHHRKQGSPDAIYCPIAEILASVYGV